MRGEAIISHENTHLNARYNASMGSVDITLPHANLDKLMNVLKTKEFPIKVRHVTLASIENRQFGGAIKETHSEHGLDEENKSDIDSDLDLEGEDDDEETIHHPVSYRNNGVNFL